MIDGFFHRLVPACEGGDEVPGHLSRFFLQETEMIEQLIANWCTKFWSVYQSEFPTFDSFHAEALAYARDAHAAGLPVLDAMDGF